MNTEHEKYTFSSPPNWINSITKQEILDVTKENDFSKQIIDEGKDICFYLNKVLNYQKDKNEEYSCVIYSLTQSRNLEIASVEDVFLDENSHIIFHRFLVVREGQLIDKTADTTIRVFDNETQTQGGVYNNSKKVNISIQDLRLYDTVITERTIVNNYSEKEFIRNQFMKHVLVTPDVYWGYNTYRFELINNTEKPIAHQSFFFRDAEGNLKPSEKQLIPQGASFVFLEKDYLNSVDVSREVFPFIDFATDADWNELSNFVYPLYEPILAKANIQEIAPDIVQKLDEIPDQELKIKWAIDYVQNQIKYVYDANEMNGHQPQEAAVTYQTKQGDCKAKSVFLKSILDYLKVPSDIIVVNYRTDFYMKYYFPSLLSFNHVILRIEHLGKEFFVDPTIKDEEGTLENRGPVQFVHYLKVLPNQVLTSRPSYEFPTFCIEETIDYHVEKEKGSITLKSLYRYSRANSIRSYFKNTNKKEILDSWMNSLFYCLNFNNDRKEEDIRQIFLNPEIKITQDDKINNEVIVEFRADIDRPYFVDKAGKRFMMFYDFNTLKDSVKNFNNKDSTFWHGFDPEKYTIKMSTDLRIDTEEKYTRQENKVENPYFSHEIKKKIHKNGASAFIEYRPISNVEIPQSDLPKLKEDYLTITDSNFGLGIDIIEAGISNLLKSKVSKWFK